MARSLEVVFDGEVFRPDTPPDLQPNTRYLITVEEAVPSSPDRDAWSVLEALTGTVEAPRDWSSEHDHYLYGTPKRRKRRQG